MVIPPNIETRLVKDIDILASVEKELKEGRETLLVAIFSEGIVRIFHTPETVVNKKYSRRSKDGYDQIDLCFQHFHKKTDN